MDNKIETSLLLGLPVNINDKFSFTLPLMKEIFKIGFDDLMGSVNVVYDLNYVLYKNAELNKIIEENNFTSYDTWQLILLLEKEAKFSSLTEYLIECLKWHLNTDVVVDEDCKIIINNTEFGKDDYEYFCKILKIAYGLEERIEDRQFGTITARRKAIDMRMNRNEINMIESKTNSFLYQIISALKTKKSDNEIQNSSLFQLIDLYKRVNKEKDYDSLMTGVYTGNVDTKKVDLNKKHWTSALK